MNLLNLFPFKVTIIRNTRYFIPIPTVSDKQQKSFTPSNNIYVERGVVIFAIYREQFKGGKNNNSQKEIQIYIRIS